MSCPDHATDKLAATIWAATVAVFNESRWAVELIGNGVNYVQYWILKIWDWDCGSAEPPAKGRKVQKAVRT